MSAAKKAVNIPKPTRSQLIFVLARLAIRFPLEFRTTLDSCACLQFEDNQECRHTIALQTLKACEVKG